jgi:hypothetical protein
VSQKSFVLQFGILQRRMSEAMQIEAQGPGVLIIRLVSLLMAMRGKIQTLEKELQQKSRQFDSEVRSKSATFVGAQVQEASETQKENMAGKDMQMRQNVIPILKLQIQSLTSKIQCDALEMKQIQFEKEQLVRDLTNMKHQVRFEPTHVNLVSCLDTDDGCDGKFS